MESTDSALARTLTLCTIAVAHNSTITSISLRRKQFCALAHIGETNCEPAGTRSRAFPFAASASVRVRRKGASTCADRAPATPAARSGAYCVQYRADAATGSCSAGAGDQRLPGAQMGVELPENHVSGGNAQAFDRIEPLTSLTLSPM
jgi:hypothetical protein